MRVFVPLSRFLHRHLLWLLIASYAVAALLPAFGLWMRDVSLWHMPMFHAGTSISVPMALLAVLLFNAGLGVREMPSRSWLRKGKALWLGVGANLAVPLAFILLAAQGLHFWHNSDEVQNLLVGLALVASMPIAGSSTAWSQNADGDMGISLGLVLLTTFLSPITTPLLLHSVAWMAAGDYSSDLHEIADYGTGTFLMLFVLLPSLAGMAVRGVAGRRRVEGLKPVLKTANVITLLLLNYSNAAVSLPNTVANPDPDFLALIVVLVTGLCVVAFASGWLLARSLKSDRGQEAALMFGLGMNNNGTGLVLASAALADHPLVMVPIILYNLIQHLVAATVDHFRYGEPGGPAVSTPRPAESSTRWEPAAEAE